jgi:transcriptional regulator with XRE-family HTH domain
MRDEIFPVLGEQLRNWRKRRNLSQPALAQRLGRDRARISELERDLLGGRWGRDRLTLFAELCGALDLEPVLVPRGQGESIRAMIGVASESVYRKPAASAFDELFVDLGDDDEGGA